MDIVRALDQTLKALNELLAAGADPDIVHDAASHLAAAEAAVLTLPTDCLTGPAWSPVALAC